jgi:acetyl esterase
MLQDEGIRRYLEESEALYPPDAARLSIGEQRALYEALCRQFRRPCPSGIAVRDLTIEGQGGPVPIRIYRPRGAGLLPPLLYLHGGGWVFGGLDSHDDICAELADGAGIAVVAVQYRLAPEHPFPAAFEDCRVARDWIAGHGREHELRPDSIVLAGDSAGRNLAAALALQARDRGTPPISGQVLIYPALGGDMSAGSYVTRAEAPALTTEGMRFYFSAYLGESSHQGWQSKFARPLTESDYAGLPPAFLVAAEWDPLRDDCFDYARQLQAHGVPAVVRHEPMLVHAFLRARHMSRPAGDAFAASSLRFVPSPSQDNWGEGRRPVSVAKGARRVGIDGISRGAQKKAGPSGPGKLNREASRLGDVGSRRTPSGPCTRNHMRERSQNSVCCFARTATRAALQQRQ